MSFPKGGHHSPDAKAKMSAAKMGNQYGLGHKHSTEAREKMSISQMGNQNSANQADEAREKMSISQMGNQNALGHKVSTEERENLREIHRGLNYRAKRGHYAKVYENVWGPIPREDSGRAYDIHHRDGNRQNDDPDNLIALTNSEHMTLESYLRYGSFDLSAEIDAIGESRRQT